MHKELTFALGLPSLLVVMVGVTEASHDGWVDAMRVYFSETEFDDGISPYQRFRTAAVVRGIQRPGSGWEAVTKSLKNFSWNYKVPQLLGTDDLAGSFRWMALLYGWLILFLPVLEPRPEPVISTRSYVRVKQ